ncbi:MAG: DUF58 domain-containing protein [Pseudomonadales bacterium]|nr:DUF58 domain-containing protein [Pseudomonadales bacterium]
MKESGAYTSIEELVSMRHNSSRVNLLAHKKALTSLAGGHASSFRGKGIDFSEVRIYQPGDDIRNIDWRVTARTNKPHTKLYREERERPVYLVVDQSQSMFFGSKSVFKSVTAAKAAASLAWGTIGNGDRIGGFVFSDNEHQEIRPKEGKKGIQRLFHSLVNFNQSLSMAQKTDTVDKRSFTKALAGLNQVVRPSSLIFIISDFRSFDDISLQHLSLLKRHNDIVSIFIFDAMELELPKAGQYSFSDGKHRVSVNTSGQAMRQNYTRRFTQHHKRIRSQLITLGIPLIDLSTNADVAESLRNSLGQTSRMKRKNR